MFLFFLFFLINDQQARIAGDLIELRNKSVYAFFMFNTLFVLIVFLLQLNKDQLHVVWPLGVKENITMKEDGEVPGSVPKKKKKTEMLSHWCLGRLTPSVCSVARKFIIFFFLFFFSYYFFLSLVLIRNEILETWKLKEVWVLESWNFCFNFFFRCDSKLSR